MDKLKSEKKAKKDKMQSKHKHLYRIWALYYLNCRSLLIRSESLLMLFFLVLEKRKKEGKEEVLQNKYYFLLECRCEFSTFVEK